VGRLSSRNWVEAALDALVEDGVPGLSVPSLASRLGVTKGSFYWHFADHATLLEATLAGWEDNATNEIIRYVDAVEDDPLARLRALVGITVRADDRHARVEGAMRAWGHGDQDVAAVLQRVDRRRLDYATDLLTDLGLPPETARRRAHVLYRVLVGEFAFVALGDEPLSPGAVDELVAMVSAPA